MRSARNEAADAALTRNATMYNKNVTPPLILIAQPPNSSSLRPFPPPPFRTHCMTSPYTAPAASNASTTSQILAPTARLPALAAMIMRTNASKL